VKKLPNNLAITLVLLFLIVLIIIFLYVTQSAPRTFIYQIF